MVDYLGIALIVPSHNVTLSRPISSVQSGTAKNKRRLVFADATLCALGFLQAEILSK
jgi:hypothetical protein